VYIVDGIAGGVIDTVKTGDGLSKVVFSPKGDLAYVNHIMTPVLAVVDVAKRKVI
jgi:YVTN family beta-propeller protein